MKALLWLYAVLTMLFAKLAMAQTTPPSLADLTSAISFTEAAVALLAIAVIIAGFKVIKQGAMIVLRFLGWAK